MVAVVTDGTAVLGLGDIGPAAAMPVMEGKCALFKEFAGVDAFPICIDSKDPRVIVDTVKRIATVFGGINLEDISAPRCFQIKEWSAKHTNQGGGKGSRAQVIEGADGFVGLSGPNTLTVEMVRKMNKDAIVFAMANPVPEIMPEIAAPYVRIMATSRSDYPNQINNVLGFPGIFRGALDCRARVMNEEMKRAAAHAIANTIPEEDLNEEYIIPSVFNRAVVQAVAQAVAEAAYRTGVARREIKVLDDVQKLQR